MRIVKTKRNIEKGTRNEKVTEKKKKLRKNKLWKTTKMKYEKKLSERWKNKRGR